jgi:hypothetical protein
MDEVETMGFGDARRLVHGALLRDHNYTLEPVEGDLAGTGRCNRLDSSSGWGDGGLFAGLIVLVLSSFKKRILFL